MIRFQEVLSEAEYLEARTIITKSFITVADEFHITPENCPANPAFIPLEKFKSLKTEKTELYLLYFNEIPTGFVAIEESPNDPGMYYIEKVAVLPNFRHNKLGEKMMGFAEEKIREKGGKEISLGIINENEQLKNWYKSLGYVENGTKVFSHLPFTVGFMMKALG